MRPQIQHDSLKKKNSWHENCSVAVLVGKGLNTFVSVDEVRRNEPSVEL